MRESKSPHRFLKFLSLFLFSASFFLVVHTSAYAVTYYVTNVGNDSCNGQSSTIASSGTCAWQTIAHVNSQSFSSGDQILFKKGELWREKLIVPSSGSSGNPITFGTYSSGASPIISGSDLISGFTSTAPNTVPNPGFESWTGGSPDSWSPNVTGSSTITQDSGTFHTGSSSVKITVAAGADTWLQNNAIPASSSAQYTFSFWQNTPIGSNMKYQLKNNSNNHTLNSGGIFDGASNNIAVSGTGAWSQYSISFTSESSASASFQLILERSSGGSYSFNLDDVSLRLQSAIPANVWGQNLTTTPQAAFFNSVRGTKQNSISSLAISGDWYYDSNNKIIWIYSSTNPSSAFTNPGVEATHRTPAVLNNKNYIVMDGLSMVKSDGNGYNATNTTGGVIRNSTVDSNYFGGILLNGSSSYTIENNTVSNNGYGNVSLNQGIYLETTTNSIIQNNTLTGNSAWGVQLQDLSNNNTVRYNNSIGNGGFVVIYNNGTGFPTGNQIYYNISSGETRAAIYLGGPSPSATNNFYNNVVYNLGSSAVGLYLADNALIGNFKNNIIWSATGIIISDAAAGGTAAMTSDYNIFGPEATNFIFWHGVHYATLAAFVAAQSLDVHSKAVDPKFVSASDFHLQPSSPAINAGVNVGLTTDYAGNSIVGNPDIGAYEFVAPLVPTTLAQYKSDGTTVISSGAWTNQTTVNLSFNMSSTNSADMLTPQVEVKPNSTIFTNAVTNFGSAVAYSGSPVTGTVTVTGLADGTIYHWQAQASNSASAGPWLSNGGSPDFGVDTTTPTGGSITYTNGYYTSASVSLAVSDGTDSSSGVNTSTRTVQRDSATLSNGTCGSYGSFSTITPTGTYPNFTDTTVSSENCYQYQYLVSDNVGNQATYSSSNTVEVDTSNPTTPGTPMPTPSSPTNSTTQNWVWSAATDAVSGVANYVYRVLDSLSNVVASETTTATNLITNLTQGVYTFFVKAVDNAGNQGSESQGSLTVDTTAPTGGSITYTDGYYTSASVSLTVSDGTDTGGSNINTSSRIVQRKSATLTNGTCGSYGGFGTITPTGSYPNFTDTTVTSSTCYQYQYLVSDNAANQATYTSSNTVYVLSLPLSASSLAQYQSDGTTSISSGGTLGVASTVVLKFSMSSTNSSDTLTPQVEVERQDIAFTNTPTNTGSAVSFTGTPVMGTVTISSMGGGNYHWQARVINSAGQSSWVSMGGNPDFSIQFPPASNNSSGASAGSTGCSNQTPTSSPDLFQIDTINTKATVYFAPAGMPYDNYVIRFGPTANNLLYSAFFSRGFAGGVIYYTINELNPNTVYYFQVRAGNGCKPGEWGNTLSAKTTGSIRSTSKSYKSLGGFIKSLLSSFSPKYTGPAIKTPTSTPTTVNNTPGQCTQYTVLRGDSFWTIAQKLLGSGQRYLEIWKANISNFPTLKNSPVIRAGWKLSVGC